MGLGYVAIAGLTGFFAAICSIVAGLGIWLAVGVFYGAAFLTIGLLIARAVTRDDEEERMSPLTVTANG